ncbi:MAG: F0F1 ATP synthase subunit B [Planctomycetes bacterium]|nr:F0F1 ATP synthase subunit B [Planctomycetota bacterium]
MFGSFVRSLGLVALSLVLMGSTAVWAADAAPHAEKEAADHADDHHDTGLPMNWKQDLALFSLVTFVVYVAVLRFGAWGPLRAGLTERERRIRQDIADAEANRIRSEQMIAEREAKLAGVHDEVREILAEARRDADRVRHDIVTTAQTEAEAMKQRAIADIERSRDQALAELFDFVATNVVGATERVIGRSLNDSDHDRLVKQALSEMNIRN